MATVLAVLKDIITTSIQILVKLLTIPDAEETTTISSIGIAAT